MKMMTLRNLLALTCIIGVCWASPFYGESSSAFKPQSSTLYVDCTHDSQCGLNECCALAPNRFSRPQCISRQRVGDMCRPGNNVRLNSTLSYPNGEEIQVNDVHYVICPCEHGLTCERKDSTCSKAISKGSGYNDLTESKSDER